MSAIPKDVQQHWKALSPWFSIRNEAEYDLAVERLHILIDEVGDNERHSLYELLDTLGTVIHTYEEKYHTVPECNGVDALRFLMNEHQLAQSDLPEVGSQGVVSEIIGGKRVLNARQINALSKRFGVSPAVFF